jgi:hypothetical protein
MSRPRRWPAAALLVGMLVALVVLVLSLEQDGGDPQPSDGSPVAEVSEPASTTAPADACDTIRGHAAGVTGGERTVEVATFSELRDAAAQSGNRIVITGSAVLDGEGEIILPASDVTITRAAGSRAVLWNTWIQIRDVSNVLLEDLVIRTGDESVRADDADAISVISARGEETRRVAINRVEAVFGPDVSLTVLTDGGVTEEVTVQCSIIGAGLFRSAHSESGDDDGHGLSLNISGIRGPNDWPRRVTIWRNLITHSESRNPRVCGSEAVDVVNNVIYGFREGPFCNPRGLNLTGNVLREGPLPEDVGLEEVGAVFRVDPSDDFSRVFANGVYEADNICDSADGTGCARIGPPRVFRSGPFRTPSVVAEGGEALLERVLASVGPTERDAITQGWLDDVRNRTGEYWSGGGGPPPVAVPTP